MVTVSTTRCNLPPTWPDGLGVLTAARLTKLVRRPGPLNGSVDVESTAILTSKPLEPKSESYKSKGLRSNRAVNCSHPARSAGGPAGRKPASEAAHNVRGP